MFSPEQKHEIAAKVEAILLSYRHPEMPTERPRFALHVDGRESWSWADITPNWEHEIIGKSAPGIMGSILSAVKAHELRRGQDCSKCAEMVMADAKLLQGGAWKLGASEQITYHWARNHFAGVCGAVLG